MKTKNIFQTALSMTAALMMIACSSEEMISQQVSGPATTIPYTVTVNGGEATTRATVENDRKTLYFAAGDKLYVTGTNINGVLDITSGTGTASATFSGNLNYTGSGSPASDLSLSATLVSAQQTDGTEVSINPTTNAVTVNYPTTAYCTDVATAVQKYSNLQGTSTFGKKSFTLSQQTAFLDFVITLSGSTTSGTSYSAVVSNGGSALCTANVTPTTENNKVVAKFVLPVAANTSLSSANVKLGEKDPVSFGDSETLTGKVYNVKKEAEPLAVPMTLEILPTPYTANGLLIVRNPQPGMKYSKNGGTKTTVEITTGDRAEIKAYPGDKFAFYGNGTSIDHYYDNSTSKGTRISVSSINFKVYGNIMSLVDEEGFANNRTLTAEHTFSYLFSSDTYKRLIDASDLLLPATTLTANCYTSMFFSCKGMTNAPKLPAMTLANYCYYRMFEGCISLTATPELPTTDLKRNCYDSMFMGCTSLTTVPENLLPATDLTDANNCYQGMFQGCTNLTTVPKLPATKLEGQCYDSMFMGCTSLTTVPEDLLPATELKDGNSSDAASCYQGMFQNCTSLTIAPKLPATWLSSYCYQDMFKGCIALTTAPKLPATTLVPGCFQGMFSGCTSLTKAYVKGAYNATYCAGMFDNCTDATTSTFYSDDAANWKIAFTSLASWQAAAYE